MLERLIAAKLEAEAETIRAEGWAWVDAVPSLEYGTLQNFQRIPPEAVPLSDEQQEECDHLSAEYDSLIEEHGDDPEPEITDRLDALSEQIDALSQRDWCDEDKSFAGVIVAIGQGGKLQIERGLIRPEDAESHRTGNDDPSLQKDGVKAVGGLSAPLIEDLTAHRTMVSIGFGS